MRCPHFFLLLLPLLLGLGLPAKGRESLPRARRLHHHAWSRGSGGHVAASARRGGGRLCLYTTHVGGVGGGVAGRPPLHSSPLPEDAWLRCGHRIYCQGQRCGSTLRAAWISRDSVFGGTPLTNASCGAAAATPGLPGPNCPQFMTMALLWHARNGPVCPTQDCVLQFDSGRYSTDFVASGHNGSDAVVVTFSPPLHAWHRMIGEIDAAGLLFDDSGSGEETNASANANAETYKQRRRRLLGTAAVSITTGAASASTTGDAAATTDDAVTVGAAGSPIPLSASESKYVSLLEAVSRVRAMDRSGVHVSTKTIDETIINPTAVQYKEALPDALYAYLHYKIAVGIGDAIRQTAEDAETGVVGELLNTPKTTLSPASHQGAGLSYDIMWQVREAVTDELVPLLSEKLARRMAQVVPGRVSREVSRGVHATLTRALTQSMSRGIMEQISLSLTRRTTRQAVSALLPTLTLSLNSIVAQSLTRNPKSDYYAMLCDKHKVYCPQAQAASIHESNMQYYSGYYATYFSTYFTYYYGGAMGDAITEEYFAKQGRSDRLYGRGFGADQAGGADFANPPKSPGSIQGTIADKPKPRLAAVGKTPTLAQDTAGLKEGKRVDTVEAIAKRGQRMTVANEKKNTQNK